MQLMDTAHAADAAPFPGRSLRILMIASEAPPTSSGIARTIQHLRDGLRQRGHTVDVVAYPDVPRLTLGEVRLSGLAFKLPGLRARLGDYDLIHVHGEAPTVSDAFLLFSRALPQRPPMVYTHHCDIEVGRPLNALYNAVHHRLSAVADEVVATSASYAARLGAENHTSVIPLGVEAECFATARPKDSRFTVLFVGQFRPYKGVPVLLEAMARVSGARLLVAGRGPEEHLYRQRAEELGLDVEFHVSASDAQLRELYQRAHAVVLPSVTRAEAFGLVLLEGMAAGCVPVASDLPGVREVLGRIGFTFPVGSADDLARTLRRLRDEPALLEQVSARARERAATFTWDRTVEQYERLFVDLVATRELRHQLEGADATGAERQQAVAAFVQLVAGNLHADHVEVLLRMPDSRLQPIASAASPMLSGAAESKLERVTRPLAEYAGDSNESVLLAPRPLEMTLGMRKASAMAAPLCNGREAFGVLVAARQQAYEQADLAALERLARHVAPVLRRAHEAGGWHGASLAAGETHTLQATTGRRETDGPALRAA